MLSMADKAMSPVDHYKILIADDETSLRLLVRATLENDECQVFEARDGHEALRLAREVQPNLIFLDVVMPGLTGYEVCRALRQDADTHRVVVVMLTGQSEPTDRQQGFTAGADHYLIKPFSPLELLQITERVFSRQMRA